MADDIGQLCHDSLGEMYLALNPGYEYVPYQQERIVPVLKRVECGDIKRLMLFMPAGHAKSEICTKTFMPWFLGRNPKKNLILLTHTDPLAKDFGSHIRNTMSTSPVFHLAFPDVKIDPSNHAGNFFRTIQGGAFYSFGMDGGYTGRRADGIVIDDPIKNLEEALSETTQHMLYETYKGVVKDRLRPHGWLVMVVTRWAPRDLAGRILEDEGKKWSVLVLKAQDKPDGPYLWEEFYGRDWYEEHKADSYIWNAKWQQEPVPRITQGFNEEWLCFYKPDDLDKIYRYNTYILCDPALGKDQAHDRTCILVLAAGPDKRWFLVDAVLDRIDPIERIDALVKFARKWRPKQILQEEYSLAADSVFLKAALEKEGMADMTVTSVGRKAIKGMDGGRLKKYDRIIQLVSDFKGAKIWLPKRMERTLIDGTKFEIISYFVNREYLPYAGEGSVAHDDMLDCLSRIHEPELVVEWGGQTEDVEEDYDHAGPTGGSWESAY